MESNMSAFLTHEEKNYRALPFTALAGAVLAFGAWAAFTPSQVDSRPAAAPIEMNPASVDPSLATADPAPRGTTPAATLSSQSGSYPQAVAYSSSADRMESSSAVSESGAEPAWGSDQPAPVYAEDQASADAADETEGSQPGY
jgi:hypothetical protein